MTTNGISMNWQEVAAARLRLLTNDGVLFSCEDTDKWRIIPNRLGQGSKTALECIPHGDVWSLPLPTNDQDRKAADWGLMITPPSALDHGGFTVEQGEGGELLLLSSIGEIISSFTNLDELATALVEQVTEATSAVA